MPADAGSLKSNLPAMLSSFVGREQELRELQQRLGQYRLVTLTGTGGTGSDTAGAEAAAAEVEHFADGVWLAQFAGIASPDLLIQTISKVFALPETPTSNRLTIWSCFFSPNAFLLVLDNGVSM